MDFVVGFAATVDELLEKYDAIFLGTGAGSALVHGHAWRKPGRRLFLERIPDPRQSDESLPLPRI